MFVRTLKRFVPGRWWRSNRLESFLPDATKGSVVAGPFVGMRYVGGSRGSVYWPKLLGTYELELRAVLDRAVARAPARVLVAGAAEGYYAVGLARRLPNAEVFAWEPSEEGRALLSELAGRNGVEERIRVAGLCDLPGLAAAVGGDGRILLVVDIEGSEAILIDPRVVPALRHADILVETHECFVPGVTEALLARFAETHDATRLEQTARRAEDVTGVEVPAAWSGALAQLLSERRPSGNGWIWLEARNER